MMIPQNIFDGSMASIVVVGVVVARVRVLYDGGGGVDRERERERETGKRRRVSEQVLTDLSF